MHNVILFDIDGVLFDSERFGQLIRARFTKILGIDEEELTRANADYYAELSETSDFSPHEISDFLSQRYGKDVTKIDHVFWEEEEIYKESLFPEVRGVLEALAKKSTLGVFSQGDNELQNRKLDASKLRDYFSPDYIFILRRKLSDEAIELLPRGSTFIDNKHDVVEALKNYVDVIWVNRKSQEKDPAIRTIHSLTELTQ